jgi:histidine triad (HIT) family protein
MKHCIFCKIINGEISSSIIYQDEEIFCFKDINPEAPVHVIIIPKKHIESINNLEEKDGVIIGNIFVKAKTIAKILGIEESGYRIVSNCGNDGGQSVNHIHFHLLGGRLLKWPPG